MATPHWQARNKRDLMIEVWEWLDCESVGAGELRAIAGAVQERFGAGAVESPAVMARLLADEGAELRHPEVMSLDVAWRVSDKYAATFRNVLKLEDLPQAAQSLRRLDNLRRQFARTDDQAGLRRLREVALAGKNDAHARAGSPRLTPHERAVQSEIAEWLRVWLSMPEIFFEWLELRLKSPSFQEQFDMPEDNTG